MQALNRRGCQNITIVDHCDHPAKRRNLERLRYEDYIDKTALALLREGRAPKVSGVFHLGACSSTTESDEAYLRDNNLEYSASYANGHCADGARFVYASSAATYGDGFCGYCDDDAETPRLRPLNLYGWSKQLFDLWTLRSGRCDTSRA